MNVLDLFSGAVGGWSTGLERAGYRTVAACEIDPWRRGVFAARHPGCVMYADVRDLTADRLLSDLGSLPDVVVGSPPCQEVSLANTKGTGITDDHLFWEWVRLVFEVRPVWCAAENSPGARTDGIDGILDALDQAGYAAWPCVVGADSAGANHRRKRMWLVAADAASRSNERSIIEARIFQQSSGRIQSDDPDSDGRIAGGARRDANGRLLVGARADGKTHTDAPGIGRDRLRSAARGTDERPRSAGDALPDAGHAPVIERLRQRRIQPGSGAEPVQADLPINLADPDCDGLAIRPCLSRSDGAQLPPALRDIGTAWPDWNGGLPGLAAASAAAGFGRLDDGPGPGLPAGLRNRAIAALGDAVIPEIPEAIGRAMRAMMDEI